AFGHDLGQGRILIRQKVSQSDLAAMAGIARENVSRGLNDWGHRSLVSRLAGYYCLENKAVLDRESGGENGGREIARPRASKPARRGKGERLGQQSASCNQTGHRANRRHGHPAINRTKKLPASRRGLLAIAALTYSGNVIFARKTGNAAQS